ASVDVVANNIAGPFQGSGIVLDPSGASGTMTARVLNNFVLREQAGGGSFDGAIVAYAEDAALSAVIVNNTVEDNDRGILCEQFYSGLVTGVVANNAIAGSVLTGLGVTGTTAVVNHHNLFFDNADDFAGIGAPGPGSVFADPLFTTPGDWDLPLPGSPAIDAGDTAAVPVDLTQDFEGRPRVYGLAVDIGAYEVPEPPASASAATAVLAVAALGRRVRRRSRCR
ncbi:MAG: hypothetical protein NTZ61_03460, partial [Proteobacteria bacterium]|nr:hypothetical protein [Pseudomonadota bacterium]